MNKNIDNAIMIGRRLARARESAGMNRKDLERTVGISADTVKDWEYGRHIPPADKIAAICNCLHISADPVLGTGEYRTAELKEELNKEAFIESLSYLELKDLFEGLSELSFADKRVVIGVALETARQLKSRRELG